MIGGPVHETKIVLKVKVYEGWRVLNNKKKSPLKESSFQ